MSKKYKVREFAKEINLILTLREFDWLWDYVGDSYDNQSIPIFEKMTEIKKRLETKIDEEELTTWTRKND